MNTNFNESSRHTAKSDYAMSADYACARGVPAVKVSLRNATLISPGKRDFIWYLQSLSLRDGGFKRLTRELVEMFPERLGTEEMHKAKIDLDKAYPAAVVMELTHGLASDRWAVCSVENEKPAKGRELIHLCRRIALGDNLWRHCSDNPSLENFLIELCVNPAVLFSLPGVDSAVEELESHLVTEQNPALRQFDFRRADLVYFGDIIGALLEYRAREQKKIRDNFYLTAIGKQIWENLDFALVGKSMVLINGLEGRGKSEAVKAWCQLHPGQSRFVNLKGVATKSAMFRAIAEALGVTYAYNRTGPEMQARIEDVLRRSKIMLVIDEAHFAFNQTRQMTARPELIDWIDTALCNDDLHHKGRVPVALVTTPQFMACMARAKIQVEWNYNQFRRRVKRWITLPARNSEADIAAVARKVFKGTCEAAIKKIVGYALLSKRDLSAVGDVATEISAMLGTEDLSKVSLEHVSRAIEDFLIPSDLAFKVALTEAEAKQRPSRRKPAPALPTAVVGDAADLDEPEAAPAAPEAAETLEPVTARSRVTTPALGSAIPTTRRGGLEPVLSEV